MADLLGFKITALAAALLADCGAPATFFQRHTTFLRTQDRWMERL